MSVAADRLAGRYRLVSVIATGGMGVVWEGWDERLERPVAIKQLKAVAGMPPAEAELAKRRAMREARITARLHHPHAVPVFDAVEHDGQPCLIMPLLPSTPLSDVLRERGRLPLREVLTIGAQVASALSAAHELGVVHRDVKPGNILMTADRSAHLSDFGISHAMGDATLTRTGLVHGTPAYLAPEVARGQEASFSSDVFSLGSTMFAALEGAPPFGSDPNSIALLHRVASGTVPPPERAGTLTPFLLRMLAPDSDERPTMAEVAATLGTVVVDDEAPGDAVTDGPDPVAFPAALGAMATQELEPASAMPADPAVEELTGDPELDDAAGPDPGPAVPATLKPAHTPASDPRPRRRRRRSPVLALTGAALLLMVLLTTAVLTGRLGDDPGGTAAPAETPNPSASAESATGTATDTPPDPRTAPTPEPSAAPEPEPSAEPEAETQPEPEPEPQSDRSAQLASTVTDYYALLPDNTADAWPTMTAEYQENHAGGFESYESFWGDITDVAVSDVEATAPDGVVATLTYTFRSGRVDVERTAYRLVDDGGRLKIAATQVLSSRSQ
ncbi:MAG: protein kinase [Dermatophilaceae bacterium]